MKPPDDPTLLRIFIGEPDRCQGKPLCEQIIDTGEKINQIVPFVDETVAEGPVTLEKMRVITHRHSRI